MPPKGTAGFARSRVSGSSRWPLPPARITAATLLRSIRVFSVILPGTRLQAPEGYPPDSKPGKRNPILFERKFLAGQQLLKHAGPRAQLDEVADGLAGQDHRHRDAPDHQPAVRRLQAAHLGPERLRVHRD